MHIDRVSVVNILGFRKLSVVVDPELQLIAGPNNAGKSSMLRVLESFFSDPTGEHLRQMKPLHDYYSKSGPRTLSSIQVKFSGLSPEESDLFSDAIDENGNFWVKIKCTRGGKISYQASRKAAQAREIYDRVLESFSFVKIPSVRVSELGQSENDQSLVRLYETLEGVLVRSGGARKTLLQKEFEDAIAPVEKLVHRVLTESVEAVSAELPFRERELGIKLPDSRYALRGMLEQAVITSKDEIEVSIAERGTGFQSAMVLGVLRYVASRSNQSAGNVVFVIEEPEAFLHPQTQRAMAQILREISRDAQLIVTTHSPVLVDSFSVSRIVRLPLSPSGMTFVSERKDLSEAADGRLTRLCDAANSELVFASAVILVEGHGDKLLVDYLLGRITGGEGGHYALGITVIEASSIDNIPYLVQLAELFGVRSYIMIDKDGIHKQGTGKRKLSGILRAKKEKSPLKVNGKFYEVADRKVSSLKEALAQQNEINDILDPWDVFVLASDLEGLLLDTIGYKTLSMMLGPKGNNILDCGTVERYRAGNKGKDELASWLGTKGWNSDGKKSNKMKPHLPAALIREHLESKRRLPQALGPIDDWLRSIVQEHDRSPI